MDNLTFMAKVASGDRSVQVLRNVLQMQKRAYDSAADAVAGNDDGISEVARYLASLSNNNSQDQSEPQAAKAAPAATRSGSSPLNDTVVAGSRLLGGYGGWRGGSRLGASIGSRIGSRIGRGIGGLTGTVRNLDLLHPDKFLRAFPHANLNQDIATRGEILREPRMRNAVRNLGVRNVDIARRGGGLTGSRIGARIAKPIFGGAGAVAGAYGAGYLADKTMNWINPYKGEGSAV